MKALGGTITALGIFFLLNSGFTYFVRGHINDRDGWGNFAAVAAVGIIVVCAGVAMFTKKPKSDETRD